MELIIKKNADDLLGALEVFNTEETKLYDIEIDTKSLLTPKLFLKRNNLIIGSVKKLNSLLKEEYELILKNENIGNLIRKNTFFSQKMTFNEYELKSEWNNAGTSWEILDNNGYEIMKFSQKSSFNAGIFNLSFKDETKKEQYILISMGLYLSIQKLNI